MTDPIDQQRAGLMQGADESTAAAEALMAVEDDVNSQMQGIGLLDSRLRELIAMAEALKVSAVDSLGAFTSGATQGTRNAATSFLVVQSSARSEAQDLVGSSQQLASTVDTWNPGPRIADSLTGLITALHAASGEIDAPLGVMSAVAGEAVELAGTGLRHAEEATTLAGTL